MCMFTRLDPEDDVVTVIASNVSPRDAISPPETIDFANAALPTSSATAIADSGATQIFIMDGTPVTNKRPTKHPLKVALADGRKVMSTHICDVDIPGLPVTLTGHIIPELSIASLFGIRVLTDVGCTVTFDIDKCVVYFNETEILRGYKDATTDLWTLPLGGAQCTPARHDFVMPVVACPKFTTARTWSPPAQVATFAHTVRTKANATKYAHQSFCSPRLSSFLKAIRRGFLTGCPNLTSNNVTRYLNPSPASSKGHMKRPHQGIRSTRPRQPPTQRVTLPDDTRQPQYDDATSATTPSSASSQRSTPPPRSANIIEDDDTPTAGNIFCFAAFADKKTGVMYSDLTGTFPFMSLAGNVCFFVVYHYESNAILGLPIPNMEDATIFKAYKQQFEFLKSKGFTMKVNVMDNQASKQIKQFLTTQECELLLVEPHNHRVNAAERAIQTFKDHFVSALATTDSEFPLQLWDRLTPQVETTLNLMRRSRIDPSKSAYEVLHGPYDWNRFPLAPPGCKAVIYESPAQRGSWGSRGVDAWYLGPSMDHYRCCHYFVPETRAYRISGSAELFPQHCQVPNLTTGEHLQGLTDEVVNTLSIMTPMKQQQVLTSLRAKLAAHQPTTSHVTHPLHAWLLPSDDPQIAPPTVPSTRPEQRVPEQRVPMLQRITNAPPIMAAPNPTNKRLLKTTPRSHVRLTRNNTPGTVPAITRSSPRRPNPIEVLPPPTTKNTPRRSPRIPHVKFAAVPGGLRSRNLISQEAINFLTDCVWSHSPDVYTPDKLKTKHAPSCLDFAQIATPMVHPTTGETISSYKKLMNDPATKDIWQRAFSKDFGGMAQGCNVTGQKGTNAIFVMTHAQIANIPKDRTITYARVVVDFRPQKEDPHRIRITAGGNLINYPGELSTRTADLTTSKLMWNSVLSTEGAKYMCLDIQNFYLSAPLDRFEYMKIPLALFPQWTIEQYNLNTHALNGFVYLEMRRAVWGLPQAGILANKLLRKRLLPHGYFECANTPGLWKHATRPISFTLVVDDFGVKYIGQEHATHLIDCIKEHYGVTEDWSGDLYCGIKLQWDYVAKTLDISMPGYIKKLLQKYKHRMPARPQHCPYSPAPKQYGANAQAPLPVDNSPKLSPEEIKEIQRVVGSILYYARAVDITVLMALSSIAIEQTKGTTSTMEKAKHLLDYLATHHDATIRYRASDMIMNVHSDASYLSESGARSRACGHFFMGWSPKDGDPIKLNGAFFTLCAILRFVVASAAEAELGALFLNCKEGMIFRMALEELGHPQPRTQIHCDNATAVGIANNTVKRQRSRSMDMRYFWVADKEAQDIYDVKWHPGQENLADYQSKHHTGAHHQAVRPWYLHEQSSPLVLPRANRPSTLKGCVGTLPQGYIRNVPLPQVPRGQSAQSRQVHTIPDYYEPTYVVPTYRDPRSLIESAAFAFSPAWHAIAINS